MTKTTCAAALTFLLVLTGVACTPQAEPALARYLAGAEIQAESDEQRQILAAALDDMSRLPEGELRSKRYGPRELPLPSLLRAHLMPAEPIAVEDNEFYEDGDDPRVRDAIAKLRQRLPR
jgi:hypothetical protein